MSVNNGVIRNMGTAISPRADGDLQVVFSTSAMNKAWFFASAPINVAARCKPFIYNQIFSLDAAGIAAREAARSAARFGFDVSTLPTLGSSFEAVWTYNRPNGSSTQPRRTMDFEGYNKNAVAPLSAEMMGCTYGGDTVANSGSISVLLKFNGSVTGWDETTCIKFRELIAGGSSFWGYYLCYLFWDTSTNERNFIVTKDKLSDVLINDDMQWGNGFYQVAHAESGYYYPSVPLLRSGNAGHTIRGIVCLRPSGASGTTSGYPNQYNVYTSSTSPTADVMAQNSYSLAFVQGCDRDTAVLTSRTSMEGTTGSVSTFLATDASSSVIIDPTVPVVAYKFIPTLAATIDTRNTPSSWPSDDCKVTAIIRIHSTSGIYMSSDGGMGNHHYTNTGTDSTGIWYEYEADLNLYDNSSRSYTLTFNIDNIWLIKTGSTTARTTLNVSVILRQFGTSDISLGISSNVTISK